MILFQWKQYCIVISMKLLLFSNCVFLWLSLEKYFVQTKTIAMVLTCLKHNDYFQRSNFS